MKIILGQPELEAAIRQHIGPTGWGIPLEGKHVTIEMKAHRGDTGFSAVITLDDAPKAEGTSPSAEPSEDEQAIDFDFATTEG